MRRSISVAWRRFSVLGAALAVRLFAQEVTEAPLAWLDPREAPEELPTLKRSPRVEFPEDLRKTPDIGWAMIDVSLNEKGKSTAWVVRATQPAYARALAARNRGEHTFLPGKRGGAAVNTRVRITAVFNPASADPKKSDATPRLLDAAVIEDPQWQRRPNDEVYPQQVVWAVASLDAQGQVTALRAEPKALQGLLEPRVRTWRFAPARRAGVDVAAEVRVPCIVVPPDNPMGKNQVLPRVIKQRPPIYPLSMRMSGLRGDVMVDFTVDAEGRVRDAVVFRSLNPAFDQPALDAVRDFKFEPGRVDGRAVNTRMRQPISFFLDNTRDGGGDGMELRRRGDPAKLPAGLRYDTAPKIDATAVPRYPYELLRAKVRGSAKVNLIIGSDGKVARSKVAEADRPEFGYALQAATELFEYLPAIKDGQPTPAMLQFQQDFDLNASGIVNEEESAALALEKKHPERILKARDLDEKPKLMVSRAPIFPKSVADSVTGGQAVVAFLVDEKGEVRLPRVVSASDPVFGYAAVQAISTWRFRPPTSRGKPGIVRVEVPIEFVRPPVPAPAKP